MTPFSNDTALLLFSRTVAAESAAKDFFNGKSTIKNKRLAAGFIYHTKAVAAASKLPFFFLTEKQQMGKGFGEKLCNAIELVQSEGYQKVIIIGNDCLQLTSNHLLVAAAELAHRQAVLMPTAKGGVSLIGLHLKDYDYKALTELPWQTEKVFECLTLLHLDSFIFPSADDVNNFTDLKKNHVYLSKISYLFQYVTSCIASLHFFNIYFQGACTCFSPHRFGLRAPPVSG